MALPKQYSISQLIATSKPDTNKYEALYRKLHTAPELSFQETETAKIVTDVLSSLNGVEIRTGIAGTGVVGIVYNGEGPTVLLRAELDALPIAESTGFSFASTKTMHSQVSKQVEPVMHACGHDIHMISQLAATELLCNARSHWKGTLVSLFQPAEELGQGAKAMVEDGLYDPARHNVPIPDVGLGGHVMPLRAGVLKTRTGVINGSADSFRVTIYGRGGHGARPHYSIDPVVIACSTVMKLQTIISRHISPMEYAVLTVSSIHAGSAPNIIPDSATLLINIRAFNNDTRSRITELMTRIIKGECTTFGTPRSPLIEAIGSFPLLENDVEKTETAAAALKAHFGDDFNMDATQSSGSEDFADLAIAHAIPLVFWNYGCIDEDVWDKAEEENKLSEIPGTHSPGFAPALQPTFSVGLSAYAVSALSFLLPPSS